jgi:hypothetical protein
LAKKTAAAAWLWWVLVVKPSKLVTWLVPKESIVKGTNIVAKEAKKAPLVLLKNFFIMFVPLIPFGCEGGEGPRRRIGLVFGQRLCEGPGVSFCLG